jgi:hypothetical protein
MFQFLRRQHDLSHSHETDAGPDAVDATKIAVAEVSKSTSRRCRLRLSKRHFQKTETQLQNRCREETSAYLRSIERIIISIRLGLIRSYGFEADPTLSPRHNAVIQLGLMPPWLYFSRPVNLSYHNLCVNSSTVIPALTRSLLGLGLNFCLRPGYTTKATEVQFDRFQRDLFVKIFFAGHPPLPPTKLLSIISTCHVYVLSKHPCFVNG